MATTRDSIPTIQQDEIVITSAVRMATLLLRLANLSDQIITSLKEVDLLTMTVVHRQEKTVEEEESHPHRPKDEKSTSEVPTER